MFKKIFLISFLFLSFIATSANAAYFQIENHLGIKCERWHQFRAVLYLNNGARIDLTNSAIWASPGNDTRRAGEFYFEFNENARRQNDRKYVSASVFYGGYQFRAAGYANVSQTPDYMEVIGPSTSRSRGVVNFQAIGIYAGKRIELTDLGDWSADYGDIDDEGRYLAPSVTRGDSIEDEVKFKYGRRKGQAMITVSGSAGNAE